MTEKKVLVLIPARHASKRFPGKPLVKIGKKTMIQVVYENCSKLLTDFSPGISFEVAVVTDGPKIEDHLLGLNAKVLRVDDPVKSGSERIFLAYQHYFASQSFDLIINVQGDEPLLKAEEIFRLASSHFSSGGDIATLIKKRKDFDQDFYNENLVKVIYSEQSGKCHYFSRASIPFPREKEKLDYWYQHIGVYSFTAKALEKFHKTGPSYFEQAESLEQLRALELGLSIQGVLTEKTLMGVDIPEDLQRVQRVIDHV